MAAADALTRLGEPSWQSAIKGKEGDVDRLATMDDSRKFEPLFAALESAVARSQEKEDESLRYVPKFPELPGTDGGAAGVIHALAKLGDRRCSGPVARFIRDIDLGWRVYAAVDAAVRLLGECGDESGAEVLIECLSSLKGAIRDGHRSSPDSYGVEVCEPAIDALTKLGSVAVPPLIRTLGQGCDRERATKARILGEIGDRRAIDALIDRIGDIDGPVRASAAKALARLGEPKWQQWITGDELQDAERIAKSGEKRAVEFVVQMMDLSCRSGFWSAEPRDIQIKLLADMLRTAPDIYGAAASRALAGRGSAAVASVVELLNDSNPTVRRLAAEALGSMSYPAAVEALSRALEDDDDRVLKFAGESLRKLKQAEP